MEPPPAAGEPVSAEQSHGAHGGGLESGEPPEVDETLEHPLCVFQVLKRHFARYTPELVQEVCGIPPATFHRVADALVANSGRERTTAFVYSVGWTHHTTGAQYIRAASILQLLLGNIGRPGGGILALRGHASIQGSTDIPTLYNILPGYLPMPSAAPDLTLESHLEKITPPAGFWGHSREYLVSLLKAWWGDAATAENDFCFDHLPRIDGDHSIYPTICDMRDGKVEGFFVMGENPAVGSGNAKLHRLAMAELKWLVVRDLQMIESATFWKDGPESRRARSARRPARRRSSSCRRPPTPRRTGRSPTRSGCSSGTARRSTRRTTAARSCGSWSTSADGSARSWPARPSPATGRSST